MELLYEASNFKIQIYWIVPFAILGLYGLMAEFLSSKIVVRATGVIALIICALVLADFCYGYVTIVNAYKNGNYQTIEGKVENFVPASLGGETTEDEELESFNIRRQEFAYGNSFITKFGYHKTSAHGGYIHKNGQRLKIGYIPTEKGNVIVRIEEKKAKK